MTVDQAVQEATHTTIGYYRWYNPDLASEESAFTHFPTEEDVTQGVHTAVYTEPRPGESAR